MTTTTFEDDLKARIEEDPVYAASRTKLTGFQLELSELETRISGAELELSEARREGLAGAVDRVLAGDETDVDEVIKSLNESQEEMRRRRRVLMLVVERQRRIADEALNRVSISICEELRPEYEAVLKELAAALVVASQASEREYEFRDRLRAAGVKFTGTLRPSPFTALREPRDYNSNISMWFRDGVKNGHLSVEDVPVEWREGWGLT